MRAAGFRCAPCAVCGAGGAHDVAHRASANLKSQVKGWCDRYSGCSRWSWAGACGGDRLSAVDFEVRQNEQGSQEAGGAGGVGAELGEGPPVLEVREAVFDWRAS